MADLPVGFITRDDALTGLTGGVVKGSWVCVEASAMAGAHHLNTSPRTKIKVEQMPQDALRCGLSGVASFVRSDVARVVYANYPRRHRQVTAGIIYLPVGSVENLFHDEVVAAQADR